MSLPTYCLRDHAFICRTAHHWVILDRARDQYLCIARQEFERLAPWLQGWPEQRAGAPRDMPEDAAELATALMAREILSEGIEQTKSVRPIAALSPTQALDTRNLRRSIAARLGGVPLVLLAAHRASRQLEKQTLAATIRRIEARKRRHGTAKTQDPQHYAPHVATFNAVRPLVPRAYQCLFDSLALLELLAFHRLFPLWTFGVMCDPFQAHCWLEAGNSVLNDTVERVSLYIPIMRI
jgi:hypothetical protein